MSHSRLTRVCSTALSRLSELMSEDYFAAATTAREDMTAALRDPLLYSVPDDAVMAQCVRRGKVLCHLYFYDGDSLPILSADEQRLLDGLKTQPSWLHGVWILQNAGLEKSDDELIAIRSKADAGTASPVVAAWVRDLASAFAFVVGGNIEKAMLDVAEFYGDGLPFTSARFLAMLKAKEENPSVQTAPRTYN